jgi:YHS domain-containing protein
MGKGERSQVLGPKGRTERALLSGGEYANKFCAGGIMTTDPVCGMRVDEKRAEFQTQFAGKKYFFCSEECRKEFEDQPQDYVETAA